MNKSRSVYFDAETTGLDDKAEIIQVGIVDQQGATLFESLVQCQDEMQQEAVDVHGITKEDLVNAPTWPEIHEQVCNLLSNADITKIYNARFDLRLLRQTAARYDLTVPTIKHRCLMNQYADLYFEGHWQKLSVACYFEHIDVSQFNEHNAIDDCNMTRLLDLAIEHREKKRAKNRAYQEKYRLQKLALIPDNTHEYPYFAMKRPLGCKTLSQLNKSEFELYEFAGTCCDTYGGRGYLFTPVEDKK